MNGWILLHKKIWENPRFYKNYKAIVVWVWLLTHCNDNGIVTCGRQQIAEDCGVSESAVYRLLKSFSEFYLENDPILNIKPNNRFSIVHILKWRELQRKVNTPLNNHRTTSEQRVNTNKEERIKNKEKDTKVSLANADKGNPEINELLGYWKETFGETRFTKEDRYSLNNLLKAGYMDIFPGTPVERVRQLIDICKRIAVDQYAPSISSPHEMHQKFNKIKMYVIKKKGENASRVTKVD